MKGNASFSFEYGRGMGIIQGHNSEMDRLHKIMDDCKCKEREGECPFEKDGLCRLDGKTCQAQYR